MQLFEFIASMETSASFLLSLRHKTFYALCVILSDTTCSLLETLKKSPAHESYHHVSSHCLLTMQGGWLVKSSYHWDGGEQDQNHEPKGENLHARLHHSDTLIVWFSDKGWNNAYKEYEDCFKDDTPPTHTHTAKLNCFELQTNSNCLYPLVFHINDHVSFLLSANITYKLSISL